MILPGCSLVKDVKDFIGASSTKVYLNKVTFKADDDANDNSAVKIHIVIVHKEETLKTLISLDSESYFKKIDDMKDNDPNKESFEIFEADIVPGISYTMPINLMNPIHGIAGFIFSNYSSKGKHRKMIGSDQVITIHLKKDNFDIISLE
jgi:hypothetical protein